MPLTIVQYNEPILRKKGEKIARFDAVLRAFADQMVETMNEAEGIGLAAQQVGRAVQLCVVDLRASEAEYLWELDGRKPPRDLIMPMILANPVVTAAPGAAPVVSEEGCLSFPEIRGEVERPGAISVMFNDERGGGHVLSCDGLFARCIQHEVDHLNGILFIDRMAKKVRAELDPVVKALAKKTSRERKEAGAEGKNL